MTTETKGRISLLRENDELRDINDDLTVRIGSLWSA
jgi:hypothetical protein